MGGTDRSTSLRSDERSTSPKSVFHIPGMRVPLHRNTQSSLFLWDWSLVADPGARAENLVASHLLKAVQAWTDVGLGAYDTFHLRGKAS